MFGNWWYKKEMPFRGWTGFGGGATGLTFKAASGIDASGGTTGEYDDSGNSYKYHKFTSSGSFVVNTCPDEAQIEYMIIGGGAGGGNYRGGGGGAGAYRTSTTFPITAQTYTVSIGSGGAAGAGDQHGEAGNETKFYPPGQSDPHPTYIIAGGGGGGGSLYNNGIDSPTGSGGGGGHKHSGGSSGAYGNDGGDANGLPQNCPGNSGCGAAGGGGAGAAGIDMSPGNAPSGNDAGPGGFGVFNSITGSPVDYCGGGGGGVRNDPGGNIKPGPGGPPGAAWYAGSPITPPNNPGCPGCASTKNAWPTAGGGGYNPGGPVVGGDGCDNSGSGGGGNGQPPAGSGAGGSGIVVVRYVI